MPPILTQQPAEYHALVSIKHQKGVSAVVPDYAPNLQVADVITAHEDFDKTLLLFSDDVILENLLLAPSPANPAGATLNSGGSVERVLSVAGNSTNIDYTTFEIVSQDGILVNHRGRGVCTFTVDEAARATVGSGTPFVVTAVLRARDLFGTWHNWTMSINTTGSAAVINPAPIVVSSPQARSFAEGTSGTFRVPTASFFSDTEGLTYTFTQANGTALPAQWSVGAHVNGENVITYNLTAPYVAVVNVRIRATDSLGQFAQVFTTWESTDVPNPVVLGNPANRSITADIASTFVVDVNAVFDNATTYQFTFADGSALSGGWSVNLVGNNATYTFPAEGTARDFRIRGLNAASEYVDAFFSVARPAAPNIIGTASPVVLQEASSGSFQIDFAQLFSPTAANSITGAGGTALPANYGVSFAGDIATVTYNIANNEIRSDTIEYRSNGLTISTNWSSKHNPPNPNTVGVVLALNDGSITLNVVDESDDPVNNSIVANSVSALSSVAVQNGRTIVVSTTPTFVGQDTISYQLVAGSGGSASTAASGTRVVEWRDVVPPRANRAFNTTSTGGSAFASFSLATAWTQGSYAIDLTSLQFVDTTTGVLLGKTVTLSGIGTFVLDNSGNASFTEQTGWVGTAAPLAISAADVRGNRSDDPLDNVVWTHSQQAPSGTVTQYEPRRAKLTQLGLGAFMDWQGENPYYNTRRIVRYWGGTSWTTDVTSGAVNLQTGYITLAPNETRTIGRLQEVWTVYNVDPGTWVLKATYTGTANFGNVGAWSAVGGSGTVRRYEKSCSSADFGQQIVVTGGASGGTIRIDYTGPASQENNPTNFHASFLSYCGEYDILRFMDWVDVNGAKMTRASDWIPDGWYTLQQDTSTWPTTPPVSGRNNMKGGFQFGEMFRLCGLTNTAAWINLPTFTGAFSTEAQLWAGGQTNSQTVALNNAATILSQAKVEFQAFATMIANSMIANNYPDNKVLLMEFGNESWNNNFGAQKFYCDGIGQYLQNTYGGIGTNNLFAAGNAWLTCIMAEAFKTVFATLKPNQEIYFILNLQTNFGTNVPMDRATAAINLYNSRPENNGVDKLSIFLSPTLYPKGCFQFFQGAGNLWGATTETEWATLLQAALAVSETNLFDLFRDFFTNPANTGGHTTRAIYNHLIRWRDYARANGYRGILPYEGSWHDDASASILPDSIKQVTFRNFMRSQQMEDIWDDALNLFTSIDPRNTAAASGWQPTVLCATNYKDIAKDPGPGGPWHERSANEIVAWPSIGAAGAWKKLNRSTIPPGGGSSGGGGSGGGTPPPTLFELDFEGKVATNAQITAGQTSLESEGWSLNNTWTITANNDGTVDTLRGTSISNNAVVNFRSNALVNKSLKFRFRIKPDAAKTGGLIQFRDSSGQKLEVEALTGGKIKVVAPSPAGVTATALIDTTIDAPSFNITDGAWHTLVLTYFSDPTNGSIKLEEDNGGVLTTIVEKTPANQGGTYNSDPHNTQSTLYQMQLRYKVAWSGVGGDETP